MVTLLAFIAIGILYIMVAILYSHITTLKVRVAHAEVVNREQDQAITTLTAQLAKITALGERLEEQQTELERRLDRIQKIRRDDSQTNKIAKGGV